MYVDASGEGYSQAGGWSRRVQGDEFRVDLAEGRERLTEVAMSAVGVFPQGDDAARGDMSELGEAYDRLPLEVQRCVCVMMDHRELAEQYGGTSPQARAAREVYAAMRQDLFTASRHPAIF